MNIRNSYGIVILKKSFIKYGTVSFDDDNVVEVALI